MGFIRVLVVLAGVFAIAFLAGRIWNLKPETKSAHVVHRGEEATVWVKDGGKVWVTAERDRAYDVQVAITQKNYAALAQLESANAAFSVDSGTRVKVLSESSEKRRIEILDGPQAGKTGWVVFEYLQLPKRGEM
jgi:hypothetical protein